MNTGEKYWFKRKKYGYGWTPATWQGWAVITLYIAIAVGGAATLKDTPKNTFSNELWLYLLFLLVSTVALIKICYKKGPSPRWQWGKGGNEPPASNT